MLYTQTQYSVSRSHQQSQVAEVLTQHSGAPTWPTPPAEPMQDPPPLQQGKWLKQIPNPQAFLKLPQFPHTTPEPVSDSSPVLQRSGIRSLLLSIASEVAVGTTPEPLGQSETSPQSLPRPIPARFQILGQYSWQSKGRLSNSLPSPGHLLPRSCHSRLPCPHPLACLGPRWGPTLRAWAPQRAREDGTR